MADDPAGAERGGEGGVRVRVRACMLCVSACAVCVHITSRPPRCHPSPSMPTTATQLYVGGEFVGGADIVAEMAESGELAKVLRGEA